MATKNNTGFNLKVQDHDGAYRTASADEIIHAAKSAINRRFRRGSSLTSPQETRDFLRLKLASLEHEVFAVIWLDNRHRVLKYEELFRGTIDGSSVYPREVVKAALQNNAAACIFAHNHPSGVSEPSSADINITRRLKDTLSFIDVRVLDHIVVGEECVSFAERGLI